MRGSSALFPILLATVVAGCLDISSAFIIYLVRGIGIPRGLRGIAVGLLGRETALQGGWETALLGLALHFLIMFCVVVAFYLVSRTSPWISEHPLLSGLLYGPVVYLVMYWLVVPLSRIGPRPHSLSNDTLAIAIHIFLIGLPIAFIIARNAPKPL